MNAPGSSSAVYRVLVIDDTPSIHDDFRKILQPRTAENALARAEASFFGTEDRPLPDTTFVLDFASQGEEGLTRVHAAVSDQRPYALAFVDMRMPPGWDGVETIRHLWEADPELQVVICTAYSDYTWADTVRALQGTDNFIILKKPFDNIEVLQLAHALTRKWQLARRVAAQIGELEAAVQSRTAELRLAEERFAKAFLAGPIALSLQFCADNRFIEANPAFANLVGFPLHEIIGRTAVDLGLWPDPPSHADVLVALASGHGCRDLPVQLRSHDGSMHDIRLSAEPLTLNRQPCSLWLLHDITDQLHLENQLRHAQKMEAVGHLAAGIAHDFNNLLTAINVYTEEALRVTSGDSELHRDLEEVHDAGRRAATLTRQLLIFSRKQFTQFAPVELSAVFDRSLPLLRRLIGAHIDLQVDWAPDLPQVLADEGNLEQILFNLVINARDAMPKGGRVRLRLRAVEIDAASANPQRPAARPGRFVAFAVADEGCGMPPEVRARLFEPLFTTKEIGKGTGLGLSTVYAIVHQHNGWIEVTTAPQQGATFEIFLPVNVPAQTAEPVEKDAASGSQLLLRGDERILVAEDDVTVRKMITLLLKRHGYDATIAVDGPAAIEDWKRAEGGFDLLLTDMIMPGGLSGVDLAKRLLADKPGLKIILTTGYSPDIIDEKSGSGIPGATILLKPYRPAILLSSIRNALDSTSATAAPSS